MTKRRRDGLHFIRMLCFLAVCLPNCTRCCPTGFGSCQCNWAWENCPATQNNGCGSCGGSSSSGGSGCNGYSGDDPSLIPAPEAAVVHEESDASVALEPSGTLAFVATESGTFAVASVVARGHVRVVRVDPSPIEEEPLVVRTVGDITLDDGDAPGRVIADGHGRALVALRGGGTVITVDPLSGSVVARRPVCTGPRGLALDASQDAVWIACGTGELVEVRLSDGAEIRRERLGAALDEVATSGETVIASVGSRLYMQGDAGAFGAYEAHDTVGVARASSDGLVLGIGGEIGVLVGEDFHPASALSAVIEDVALVASVTGIVADGDAYVRAGSEPFERLGTPGIAHAIAAADIGTRRVVAVQTASPRLLVLYSVVGDLSPAAFEPLE